MIHKHHIVPRHMGGTDHPDNLVELTVAEHADAHNLLYSLHKRPEDKLAELCLLGQAKDPEAIRLKCQLGAAKVHEMIRNGEIPHPTKGKSISEEHKIAFHSKAHLPKSEEHKKKIGDAQRGKSRWKDTPHPNLGKKRSPETIEKIRQAALLRGKKNGH